MGSAGGPTCTDTPTLTCASAGEDRTSTPARSNSHRSRDKLRIFLTSRALFETDKHAWETCRGWAPSFSILNPPSNGKLLVAEFRALAWKQWRALVIRYGLPAWTAPWKRAIRT